MMPFVLAFAALLALGLVGAALVQALGWGRAAEAGDVPLHAAAGAVALALYGSAVVALGGTLAVWPVYLLLAAAAALALRRRGGTHPARPGRPPADRVALILLALALCVWVAVVCASLQDRLWWDGWQNWEFKAAVLFREGTLSPAFLRPGGAYDSTNLDYPLLVPLTTWWAFRHAGAADPALASAVGAAWFGLLPLSAWSALRDRGSPRLAAGAALGTALFWPLPFFASGGTADVVVAVALVGAVVELERLHRAEGPGGTGRLAVFLALGALAKNEGMALAVLGCAAGAGVLAAGGGLRARRLAPLALPLAAAALWVAFTRSLGLAAGAGAAAANGALGGRLGLFLGGMGTLFSTPLWLPVPFLAGAGLVGASRRRHAGLAGAWALLVAYVLAVAATYVLTGGDLLFLLGTSAPRVFGAIVPAVVVAAVLSTWPRAGEADARAA